MQRKIEIPGIGEVTLAKRRGTSNLRLSITSEGKVRVGLPYWLPYQSAIPFINSRRKWIQKHLDSHVPTEFRAGQQIGKAHRLEFNQAGTSQRIRVTPTAIKISSPFPLNHSHVQQAIKKASEKALKMEAEKLLPTRLAEFSHKYNLPYDELKIRRLTSRWGSCSRRNITLSYFLMQLPWHLIDYVLLHELVHTQHPYHGPKFWQAMSEVIPNVTKYRKEIKQFKPTVKPAEFRL